jgi:hypothetical protein
MNDSKNPQHITYMASALEDSLCLPDYINPPKCRRARTFVCTRLSFQFLKGFFQEFSLNTTPLALRLSLREFHPIDFCKTGKNGRIMLQGSSIGGTGLLWIYAVYFKPLSSPRDNFET